MKDTNEDVLEVSPDMRGQLAPGRRAKYVFAGKAIVTVRSVKTEVRFTYKVRLSKKNDTGRQVYFVGLLTSPDNNNGYQYLGIIPVDESGNRGKFVQTAKSRISKDAPSALAFSWLSHNWESDQVEVWHEGSCGVCGRRLTVPESIETGIGPVCLGRV